MKKILAVIVLVCAGAAFAAEPEVLVLNSAAVKVTTKLTPATRKDSWIQNNGPNDIWCGFTAATAVLTKSFRVAASGGVWKPGRPMDVWCRAATADQVTGAATTVLELP